MKNFLLTLLILLQTFFISYTSFAQWSSDPAVNLQVCDVSGEQVLPKIANTKDGGSFICWFDNRNGSYTVYLQKINALGVKQFAPDGLLVSSFPQSSSLVDYDMISDDSNNAIIAFTDLRNGSNINPFAYKISSQGDFLWGSGVMLSNDGIAYQANPKVIKTSDNNFIFTWIFGSSPNAIAFQKLSPSGVKLWGGGSPVFLTGAGSENFTYPAIVASDNGTSIAMWSGYSGSFINPLNYKLYSQKFSSTGALVWKDTVYNLGRVTGFFVPKIFTDDNDGALCVWQDDRNAVNVQSTFVQHYTSAGTKLFPVNGTEASTMNDFNKFDACAAYMKSTGETYLVWKHANSLQSSFAIYGQRLSTGGTRMWTDDGKQLVSFSNDSYINQLCFIKDTSMTAAYNKSIFGSADNVQFAFMTNREGALGWGGTVKEIGNITGGKSKIVGAIDANGMTKIAWSDERSGADGIYAQNINFDGTLGNPTGIGNTNGAVPVSFNLSQNYPNPFNPKTIIHYEIKGPAYVSLKVYNALGNEIESLVNEKQNAGTYEITFDGVSLASGVYFYRLNAGEFSETRRMVLVK
ncbi:MAG: T9SS type A sorting domain-containing protein [Ignavibacteria bacterium]